MLPFLTTQGHYPQRTLLNLDWSVMGRTRLGSSRFHYRSWAQHRIVTGECSEALEGSSRLMAGISVDAVRGETFQLELGLAPLFSIATMGQDSGTGRVLLGASPFVRVGLDDGSQRVGTEATFFYLFQPGVDAGLFHGAQLDLTVLVRLPALTLTTTGRGEVGHSQFGPAGTVLMLSGSVLVGVRIPRG